MNNNPNDSRISKFEKRRKTTNAITSLTILGSFLVVSLVFLWIFGNTADETSGDHSNDEKVIDQNEENTQENKQEEVSVPTNNNEPDQASPNDSSAEDTPRNHTDSLDENVVEVYTENWPPVGTIQEEPHSTTFADDSQDRMEMESAIRLATNLDEDNITVWWLTNDGEQKIVSTVSDKNETVVYRVYLSWIEQQGWQPTKVELLKENDQKWRFE